MWLSFTKWSSRNSEGRENKLEKIYQFINPLRACILNMMCKSACCPLPQKGCNGIRSMINKGIILEEFIWEWPNKLRL